MRPLLLISSVVAPSFWMDSESAQPQRESNEASQLPIVHNKAATTAGRSLAWKEKQPLKLQMAIVPLAK